MNLLQKKLIAFMMVFTLVIIAGGFCIASSASAATVSSDSLISQSGISDHHNSSMADHGTKKTGADSCCVDSGSGHHIADKSVLSTKDNLKFSTAAISIADASFKSLRLPEDNVNISLIPSPPKGNSLSSVIKKE